ncbi:rhomboid family intramembrane serine protease [Serratia microhaemolytica]|uniref:rhomboid family intramembrane serine protease n=1 Tax=Serratia microhaemolytica TaxID=2675110 RepID=UPI000FDD7A7F|nr:rhomboid family intramembrane serine protease [Serratia microhaemolytica]
MNKKDSLLREIARYPLILIMVFWVVQIIKSLSGATLLGFGVVPRELYGLVGVVTSPFIHGNFEHLIANTLPFFFLACLLFMSHRKRVVSYLVVIWLTTGLITWIIGRNASHIGASGVIYGMASFLVFAGIFGKRLKLIAISILVIFFYSGLIWGLFSTERQVSWEGHLAGTLSGLLLAFCYRKSLQAER